LIPIKKRLGYGGSASVAGRQVLITSGSFSEATSISYLNMISTPPSVTMAGRVKHADGTRGYTGSLSFDLYDDTLDLFVTTNGLLERYFKFDVGINDGVQDWMMKDCKLTSLSVSGAVDGLLNAQISFISLAREVYESVANVFIRDTATPIGYWYSGTDSGSGQPDDIKDWTLTMNQEATLIYKNDDTVEPAYIKVGLVNYALSVTSYKALNAPDTVRIETKSFTLTGETTGRGFAYGGLTDLGTYSYTFETGSNTKSDSLVISVTP
jgi:hypothetical protein